MNVHMCETHSCVRRDSFIRVTWRIHISDMTPSYVRHDPFIYATWLNYMRHVHHSNEGDSWDSFSDSDTPLTTHICVIVMCHVWLSRHITVCCSVLQQCVAGCYSVLQYVSRNTLQSLRGVSESNVSWEPPEKLLGDGLSTPVPLLCLIVPLSRTKRIFGLVPEKPILSEPGSILVDGFDTRLIPWSFSCGERSLWVYCVVMCHVCNLSWCVMYTMCCDVSCIQCVVMCHVCNVLWCVMSS